MNKLYKLIPHEDGLKSHHWGCSIYKGEAIICAQDEDRARLLAFKGFGIAAPKPSLEKDTPTNPWNKLMNLVLVEEIDEASEDLAEERIIYPADYS